MHLTDALRLGSQPSLGLVGAGGKTTALFHLARELLEGTPQREAHPTVLVSATTHLAVHQLAQADHLFIVQKPEDIQGFEDHLPTGVVLIIGPEADPERMAGLTADLMNRLRQLAEIHKSPLLLECDGSRCHPLKAPAAHEPAIPDWIDLVVVVAGLSGLGQPLSADIVHRPEIFSALSGMSSGETISVEKLAGVLNHPAGGLKGIPRGARRIALLNQADDSIRQANAKRLATFLLESYDAAVIASLGSPDSNKVDKRILAAYEPTAGIILAAGASSRLGKPKQVLPWRGEPLVRHVARTVLSAGLQPVVVVTGYSATEVNAAVQDLPVSVVNNPDWQSGQSTSIKVGLTSVPVRCGSTLFLLADQPQLSIELVRGLVELHTQTLSPLVAPLIDGQRGNPVLFDKATFEDLNQLIGDTGGRALFAHYSVAWLPWYDDMQNLDVDTPEDYQRLLDMEGDNT